ncbi:hypothetical protein ATKI12_8375 [Kitasatospora sp. Ki12]
MGVGDGFAGESVGQGPGAARPPGAGRTGAAGDGRLPG